MFVSVVARLYSDECFIVGARMKTADLLTQDTYKGSDASLNVMLTVSNLTILAAHSFA